MGTNTFSSPTSVNESELDRCFFYNEDGEKDISGHYVKCLKCNKIYNFIGRCDNCSSTSFHGVNRGQQYKSIACYKCGNHFEWWICGSCNCKNPLIETFYKKKEAGCFIATAVYDNPDATEVITLRKFRDIYLLNHSLTRILVRFYYKVSPPIAAYLTNRKQLKSISRLFFNMVIRMLQKVFKKIS